ncbi:uncharacterized protein BKA55DRAFT_588991 [Fusarium redolens]|uniref:Uncharacterized protein n=1 Tax=Fusarium redolens TaxID=48865 RepID=A0A9P9KXW6_FUSRE|nr:uncharacterized protein BKA55DRAFT_588991 [Fusarium redolens]KAH7270584.1 hypothetical protein BKA55DRAFT_588991 [Fusarium redolens]
MYHIPYRQRRGYEAPCAATGTICHNPPTSLHAVDNGTRCALEVKNGNMEAYRYCPQLHLCEYLDCQNLRSRHRDQYLPLCDGHRCQYDSCRNPRDGGAGVFCRSHTCSEPYCGAFAPGTDLDDPQRFCERHRQCLRPHCPRLCHTRDNGHPTPFCGAHYCEAHDCDDGRDGGAFCHAHTCVEPGCVRGRQNPGEYCREHTCRHWNCRMRRIGREFCPQHECAYDGCNAEVVEGRFCDRHKRRMGAGFGGRRYPAPGMGYPIYDDEEDVAEGLNTAAHSANTTSVTSTTAQPLGLDHLSSALITSAL